MSTVVLQFRGPHHCGMAVGSVISLNTRSRGALKVVVATIECALGSAVKLRFGICFLLWFLRRVGAVYQVLQTVHALIPEAAVSG